MWAGFLLVCWLGFFFRFGRGGLVGRVGVFFVVGFFCLFGLFLWLVFFVWFAVVFQCIIYMQVYTWNEQQVCSLPSCDYFYKCACICN